MGVKILKMLNVKILFLILGHEECVICYWLPAELLSLSITKMIIPKIIIALLSIEVRINNRWFIGGGVKVCFTYRCIEICYAYLWVALMRDFIHLFSTKKCNNCRRHLRLRGTFPIEELHQMCIKTFILWRVIMDVL